MKTIWDEPKRLSNLAKHGIDFAAVSAEFDFRDAYFVSVRAGRHAAVGPFHGEMITVILKFYGTQAISLISARPASKKERKAYDER